MSIEATGAIVLQNLPLLAVGANFMKQKIQVSEKTKRLAFLKNRFHTSECSQSNQNTKSAKCIFRCAESMKSIPKIVKLLFLSRLEPFVFQNLPLFFPRPGSTQEHGRGSEQVISRFIPKNGAGVLNFTAKWGSRTKFDPRLGRLDGEFTTKYCQDIAKRELQC